MLERFYVLRHAFIKYQADIQRSGTADEKKKLKDFELTHGEIYDLKALLEVLEVVKNTQLELEVQNSPTFHLVGRKMIGLLYK